MSREWCAHLAGETGAGLPEGRQVREAAGFVLAAMRCRFQDLADLLWQPVDALLASRELSSLVVLLPTLRSRCCSSERVACTGWLTTLKT